jgi:hypothetical protein
MFFVAHLHGIFHHTFTTIYPSFTTQNTTFCARKFLKTPAKTQNYRTGKNPRGNKF